MKCHQPPRGRGAEPLPPRPPPHPLSASWGPTGSGCWGVPGPLDTLGVGVPPPCWVPRAPPGCSGCPPGCAACGRSDLFSSHSTGDRRKSRQSDAARRCGGGGRGRGVPPVRPCAPTHGCAPPDTRLCPPPPNMCHGAHRAVRAATAQPGVPSHTHTATLTLSSHSHTRAHKFTLTLGSHSVGTHSHSAHAHTLTHSHSHTHTQLTRTLTHAHTLILTLSSHSRSHSPPPQSRAPASRLPTGSSWTRTPSPSRTRVSRAGRARGGVWGCPGGVRAPPDALPPVPAVCVLYTQRPGSRQWREVSARTGRTAGMAGGWGGGRDGQSACWGVCRPANRHVGVPTNPHVGVTASWPVNSRLR